MSQYCQIEISLMVERSMGSYSFRKIRKPTSSSLPRSCDSRSRQSSTWDQIWGNETNNKNNKKIKLKKNTTRRKNTKDNKETQKYKKTNIHKHRNNAHHASGQRAAATARRAEARRARSMIVSEQRFPSVSTFQYQFQLLRDLYFYQFFTMLVLRLKSYWQTKRAGWF